jgi:chaperone BCS1
MLEKLKEMLAGSNQFASGGLLLMILGGLSVWLRAVPERIWYWIVRQTTMVVTVKDEDDAFIWVKEWFLEQKFLKHVRHLDLDTSVRGEKVAMLPAPGKHWFWFDGWPFEVWFSRTEGAGESYKRRIESFTFRTPGRNRAILERLVRAIAECHNRKMGVQSYLWIYDDGWEYVPGYSPRLLESVVLDGNERDLLLEDVARFLGSRQRYQRLGVPYHRGYLFYGPPGTGKTSLVSALGCHFGLSIYVVKLAEFNDRSLTNAVSRIPFRSIVLFEDIDCAKSRESRTAKSSSSGEAKDEGSALTLGVTLSGLLNVLDGFHAPTGALYVMTTNHISKLDQALLRPGRIDYRLYLGKASDEQKVELYRRFFPETSEEEACMFVERAVSAETMAEFQGLLLALEQGEIREELSEEEMADSSVAL